MSVRIGTSALALAFLGSVAAAPALGADLSEQNFKAVGTWNFTTHYKEIEEPFFTKHLPEKSGGKITVDLKSITELNLKGFEVVDLTRKGVYDIAAGVLAYVADRSPAIEGADLSGAAPKAEQMIEASRVYRHVIQREFQEKYGVHLLGMFGYPSQQFWCAPAVKKLADLKGLKVRVYGASLGDFVQGVGGTPVTIAFGEVVPALQKGVADCGITGTLPAYDAKWGEVVTHIYRAGLGWAPSFVVINKRRWEGLDKPTQDFLAAEFAEFEDKAWAGMKENDQQGFDCNTGNGPCRFGKAEDMTLVEPSEADQAQIKNVVENNVLASWAKRCGADCVKEWNATIGKVVGLQAPVN